MAALAPDALTVFAPLEGEAELVVADVLAQPMTVLAEAWSSEVGGMLAQMGLPKMAFGRPPDGRSGPFAAGRVLPLAMGRVHVRRAFEEGVEW